MSAVYRFSPMGHLGNNPGLPRLLLLIASSILLCISRFMTIFTPVPIVIAILVYGRFKGYTASVIALGATVALSSSLFVGSDLSYLASILFSALIAETFLRKLHPMKSVVAGGFLIISLVAAALVFQVNQGFSPKEFVVEKIEESRKALNEEEQNLLLQKGDKETLALVSFLNNPDELSNILIKSIPIYFIMGVFFTLWVNFYLILRTYHFYAPPRILKYSELTFLNFKVPDQVLYIVIAALAMALYGAYEEKEWLLYYGESLLKCLSVFYFFQGFGIVITFLNVYKIFGFFRTLVVILLVLMASWFVAFLGLFDTWFDFRKLAYKKKNKK